MKFVQIYLIIFGIENNSLPYESDFNERNIPTKARPIQMNKELLEYCKKEIQELMNKGLIRKSKSP